MFTAFSTALSALGAQATAVDVVGNNLANINTPGFKANAVSFHDLVTQSLGSGIGEAQIGFGVGSPTTIRQFTQGAIQMSNGPLDAAIQGDGFLVVQDASGATLYTRGGNLQVDKSGNLLTATGEKVQGWTEQAGTVNTNAPVTNIVVPVGTVRPPTATSHISFDMNLNAAAKENDKFSSSIQVYDSRGESHVINVSLTKSANANEWNYEMAVPDSTGTEPVTGTIQFGPDGVMTTPAAGDDMPHVTAPIDGANDLDITWDLRNSDGTAKLTQFAQPSAVSANSQDGNAAAQLVRVSIGDGGTLFAQYSNGEQAIVGQLAMASIRNPESLVAAGNNNYRLSARSALPAVGVPNTGGRGMIMGGAIESSTVDIAKEFTQLIVLQRGYQANAKVVTAVDELSQETINLKR